MRLRRSELHHVQRWNGCTRDDINCSGSLQHPLFGSVEIPWCPQKVTFYSCNYGDSQTVTNPPYCSYYLGSYFQHFMQMHARKCMRRSSINIILIYIYSLSSGADWRNGLELEAKILVDRVYFLAFESFAGRASPLGEFLACEQLSTN